MNAHIHTHACVHTPGIQCHVFIVMYCLHRQKRARLGDFENDFGDEKDDD